jgi:hypothetical protein
MTVVVTEELTGRAVDSVLLNVGLVEVVVAAAVAAAGYVWAFRLVELELTKVLVCVVDVGVERLAVWLRLLRGEQDFSLFSSAMGDSLERPQESPAPVGDIFSSVILDNVTAVPIPRTTIPDSPSKSKHCR